LGNEGIQVELTVPKKLQEIFNPHRYKVAYGGRGSAKSWTFARVLLFRGLQSRIRVLCGREIQKSIADSVHALLADQITALGLNKHYEVLQTEIRGINGTEFAFAGLRTIDINKIKSYEGVDVAWIEEAQVVSKRSWDVLIPTIRKTGSEIWVTFNPELEDDDTYQRFVLNPPEDAWVERVNWHDNPWFPAELEAERLYLKKKDYESYKNVWEGECRRIVEGAIYRAELERMESEGRIGNVPYERHLQVHTAWDLGVGDATAIWFYQKVAREIRLIDYHEASGEGLPYYAQVLREKKYLYGEHYAPHDIGVREFSTGTSRIDTAASLGIDFVTVKNDRLEDGIHAVRMLFDKCWFDREKCRAGLKALRSYRWERNEKLNEFKPRPVHDFASHGSDALRYLAVSYRDEVFEDEDDRYDRVRGMNAQGRSKVGGY
jgi:phage terminase large subunit